MSYGNSYSSGYENNYGNNCGNNFDVDNNYTNSNFSSQIMIDKQKQSLKYSYETLGNLLSAAENFAGLANEKYESYNYSKATDYNGLKSEFAWELDCFNLAMKTYQEKYGPYQFPPDCPKEKILKDIQIYEQEMKNDKDKMLYHMMADLINGRKVNTNFKDLYQELDKNANNKFDPKKMNKIVGPLNQILGQAEKDAEKGNMDLINRNQTTQKAKEQLKNIPKETYKEIEVIFGEKGDLVISQNHLLYFISNINESKKQINGIDPSKIKKNGFYIFNKGIIFVSKINKSNSASCIIYNKEHRHMINENNIIKNGTTSILNNAIYTYGTYIDQKGKQYDVLFQSDEDNMK